MASVSIHMIAPSFGISHAIGCPCSASTAAACSPTPGTIQKSSLASALLTDESESRTPATRGLSERALFCNSSSLVRESEYGSELLPSARLRTPIEGRYQSQKP